MRNKKYLAACCGVFYYVANLRLEMGCLTVIDATNIQKQARASVLRLARENDCFAVAIVLAVSEKTVKERNAKRQDRNLGAKVVADQVTQVKSAIRNLRKEGFRYIYVLPEDEIANVEIVRIPLWTNQKSDCGPFDIIGDIHGCYDELCELLSGLGYDVDAENFSAKPLTNRKAVFLGDLCDRGPKNAEVLRMVMNMVQAGDAWCVAGNHDVKLLKKLKGANVRLTSNSKLQILGAKRAISVGFVTKTSLFLSFFIGRKSQSKGEIRGESAIGYQCSL